MLNAQSKDKGTLECLQGELSSKEALRRGKVFLLNAFGFGDKKS